MVLFLTLATAELGMFLLARHLTGDEIASFATARIELGESGNGRQAAYDEFLGILSDPEKPATIETLKLA